MSVHAKIDPIFHAWYTYIKKIYKKKFKVKIAIEKFWCVKYGCAEERPPQSGFFCSIYIIFLSKSGDFLNTVKK